MGNEDTRPQLEVRSFHLVPGTIKYIDGLLESGAYLSAGEVIRAGLRALQERDAAIERWLSEDVASVIDAVQAEERRVVPAAVIFASARARYADRRKNSR
jgi:antitoxin ParD1/3/4